MFVWKHVEYISNAVDVSVLFGTSSEQQRHHGRAEEEERESPVRESSPASEQRG